MSRQAFEYGYFSKNLEDIFKYFEEIMGKKRILDGNLLGLKRDECEIIHKDITVHSAIWGSYIVDYKFPLWVLRNLMFSCQGPMSHADVA